MLARIKRSFDRFSFATQDPLSPFSLCPTVVPIWTPLLSPFPPDYWLAQQIRGQEENKVGVNSPDPLPNALPQDGQRQQLLSGSPFLQLCNLGSGLPLSPPQTRPHLCNDSLYLIIPNYPIRVCHLFSAEYEFHTVLKYDHCWMHQDDPRGQEKDNIYLMCPC